jgi:hypothetical protein
MKSIFNPGVLQNKANITKSLTDKVVCNLSATRKTDVHEMLFCSLLYMTVVGKRQLFQY